MAKNEERVLLYQFPTEQAASACEVLRSLKIQAGELSPDAWREKVGYLLGRKGFSAAEPKDDEDFAFAHRVILLDRIQGKRLTHVLTSLEAAGIPRISYKAVITPYNTLWTLRYLCEHMAKEHGAAVSAAEPREGSIE